MDRFLIIILMFLYFTIGIVVNNIAVNVAYVHKNERRSPDIIVITFWPFVLMAVQSWTSTMALEKMQK